MACNIASTALLVSVDADDEGSTAAEETEAEAGTEEARADTDEAEGATARTRRELRTAGGGDAGRGTLRDRDRWESNRQLVTENRNGQVPLLADPCTHV